MLNNIERDDKPVKELPDDSAIEPNIETVVANETVVVIATEPREFKCGLCVKTFDRKFNLDRHARVHQQKVINLICSECSKTFASVANLKTHFIDVRNGKEMASPKSMLVTNKGIAPVEMVDASTQTDWKCDCYISNDELPQLSGRKWKDNLFVRYKLEPPSKRKKLD